MGYSFSKRISDLKRRDTDDASGRLSIFKATIVCGFVLLVVTFVISDSPEQELDWPRKIESDFQQRYTWHDFGG